MPIKTVACVLAIAGVLCFWFSNPVKATPGAKVMRTVETKSNYRMKRMRYRVITTGTVTSGPFANLQKDVFRFVIFGIQLQDRDRLSFTLEGPDGRVDLGSPTFDGENAFVELRFRKGVNEKGILGAAPYSFPEFRMRYNPNKPRLNFFSGKGIAQATPFLSAARGVTSNVPMTLTVHVQRPGDGNYDFPFVGQFRVRHTIKRRGLLHVYRANGK